jgi:hypothetical protein
VTIGEQRTSVSRPHAATQRLLLPAPATVTEQDAPTTGKGAPLPETPRNRLVRVWRWMRTTR